MSAILANEFEADALMKGRYQSGKCQLLMSTDGDFPTDLGDECVVVKTFTGQELAIASTSKEMLENAVSRLMPTSQSNIERAAPTFPIYEGVKSMKLCALISVILG